MPRRFLSLLLCAVSLAAQSPATKPKLLLVVVIDQFRYDYLTRFRAEYHGGFARLLEHGAVFTNAHYMHVPTVTAIGHSTVLTGATPSVSGIVGNEWYDRASKRMVTSVSDSDTQLLGGSPGQTGASPRRLLVSSVPDEMKIAGKASKAIGISIKDRSAILPPGHMADAAYWFDEASGHFVSGTYYEPALPGWVRQFDDAQPAAKYKSTEWRPLDAKPGDAPFCSMAEGNGPRACRTLEATPFGNEMLETFAEQAIEHEALGTHPGTDVLTVSFSSNDYVGHALGPDSPEVRDISIRTDRTLGKLLEFIDARLGAGKTLVVLTADHGVAPVPEVNAARKMPGGRLDATEFFAVMKKALGDKFGDGQWLIPNTGGTLYLNYEELAAHKVDAKAARRVLADAARAFPHIARVYTRDEMEAGADTGDTVGRAMRNGYYGPRSGDVFVLPEPYFIFSGHGATRGTTHGSPYGYDTHVPVIFFGPGVRAGVYRRNIAVNDVAPTIAAFFDVEPPSGAFGEALPEVVGH